MINLKIYDPAMCCSTGVCGPSVNEELVQLAALIKRLDPANVQVERYNLSQQPEAYATNPVVAQKLKEKGVEVLPLVFVDDQLISAGSYPSIEQLAALLKMNLPDSDQTSSECCPGGCS